MSIARNYVYNLIYQIVSIITPVITIPYISRVLGSYGVGVASFTNSIVQYFILFGTLGVSLYGSRTIAYVRDSCAERSKKFWEIFFFKLITTSISFSLFLIIFCVSNVKYKIVYLAQSINILGAAIDISWFFMGLEEFGKIVARNLLVRVMSLALVFVLVKSQEDIWKYVLIGSLGNILGQLIMWIYAPKYVERFQITFKDVSHHFIPIFKLFIPQIAIQIYVVLDKTMVGVLSNESEVGIYSLSQRLVKTLLMFVTAMGSVMLPRVSNVYAKGDMEGVKRYIEKSFNFASYLAFPITFGLIGISRGFVSWFFGQEFLRASYILVVMSPIIVAIAWSNVLGVQLMLPIGKEKEFTLSVTVGAVTNFILNLLLIPRYQALGASIATVFAESMVTATQMAFLRKFLPFRRLLSDVWKYFISSIAMLIGILAFYKFFERGILLTTLQGMAGIAAYYLCMTILKPEIHKLVMSKLKEFKYKL